MLWLQVGFGIISTVASMILLFKYIPSPDVTPTMSQNLIFATTAGITLVIFSLNVFIILKIKRRRNWARIIYAGMAFLGILNSLQGLFNGTLMALTAKLPPGMESAFSWLVAQAVLGMLLGAYTVWLLFFTEARDLFQPYPQEIKAPFHNPPGSTK